MGLFEKIKNGLLKTKNAMLGKIKGVLNSFTKIDEELFEQLEETMIMSDMGVETSVQICEQLRKKIKEKGITNPADIMELIQEIIADMMGEDTKLELNTTPSVILVIGVNGVGKTTTIGKLCYQLKNEGKKVIVAAADTFRAAAIEQLEIWSQRAGVDIVKHSEGSDPASVVFDAVTAAKARNCDVVICDTAGRLHNKKNLMDELAKINRVIDKQAEGCSKEVLLVLDATTGQNAVNQARIFKEAAGITGIVLTKLDGTAKGGIVISIKNELGIPVKLIGLGEKLDDLQPFNSRAFVKALFDDDSDDKVKESDYERLEGDEDAEYIPDDEEIEIAENIAENNSESVENIADDETENTIDDKSETEENIQPVDNEENISAESVWQNNISFENTISWEAIPAYNPEENITEKSDNEISEEIQSDDNNDVSDTDYNDNVTDNNNDDEIPEKNEDEKSDNESEKKKFSFKNLFKRKKK